MKNRRANRQIIISAIVIFAVWFGALPVAAQTPDDRAFGNKAVDGKRIALIIGNADYETGIGKLRNPSNDANDMAEALKRLDFKLVGGKAQLNLNRRQMLEQIREFGSQIRQGGVGVFYFAGHGVQVDRRNYLIPITDSLQYQEDAEYEAVDVDAVLREMEYAGNALNILILDACRNNALPKKTRNLIDGLIEPNRKPSGVYIAFAARDGQTASENSSGRNGLYTQELLKNLETPNLRLEDIFIRTRVKVKEISKRTQEPIEYGSLDSEFYLNVSRNAVQLITTNPNSGETAFWNSIENSSDIEDFENYLTKVKSREFSGIYKATAELKIARLKKSNIAAAWTRFRPTANLLLKYDAARSFSEGLAAVKINNKWGFIDKTGKEIIPLKYDHVGSFFEGLAWVRLNNKWGLIDKTDKEAIPLKYESVLLFSEVLTLVKSNGKYVFVDKTGKEVISLKYDFVGNSSEGLAPVGLNGKYGFIDKTGKEVISLKYDHVGSFTEGLASVNLNGKYSFINKVGREIIALKYDFAFEFSEGLAPVQLENKYGTGEYGFIDKTGKEVVAPKYYFAGLFHEGLAMVHKLGSKKGFIDKTGSEVIALKYDDAFSFSEGLAEVELNDKWGLIDRTGKEVIPLKYEDVWCKTFRKEGFIGIKLNGEKGFADIYGNEYFDF